jgi:RecA-superfamily ATPases implicated in signal transduction
MLRMSIDGLDRILEADPPAGSVLLVTGGEGTLKSSLVLAMMSRYLEGSAEHGLYASLEQTKDSHLRNMDSIGIRWHENLHIFDYRDMRIEWKDHRLDMFSMTKDVLDMYIDRYRDLTIFAIDSLNALYALSSKTNLRRNVYDFLTMLRDRCLTSILILETGDDSGKGGERFLSDGIIELGVIESYDGVKRYLQIRKMRGVRHLMEKHHLVVKPGGLEVVGPIYGHPSTS